MLRLHPRSVFLRLFGTFVLVVALVLAAETILAVLVGRGAIDGLVFENLNARTREGCDNVDRYLTDRIREVRSWSLLDAMDDILIDDRLLRIENLILELKNSRGDQFVGFTIVDRSGRVLAASSIAAMGTRLSVAAVAPHEAPEFAQRWGDFPSGQRDAPKSFLVAQPIVSNLSSEPIGWLLADIAWGPIDHLMDPENNMNAPELPDRFRLLIDAAGRVLAGGGGRLHQFPWEHSADSPADPDKYLTSVYFAPVDALAPLRGLKVVGVWKRSSALSLENVYVATVLVAACVGLFLAAGAAFVVSAGIRMRLRSLIVGATRLARGGGDYRIEEGPDDEFGQVARAFNAMTTEVDRARDALEENAERLQNLVAQAPVIITTIDRAGHIISINQVLPGYRSEDVVGTSVYDYVEARDQDSLRAAIELVFATGKGALVEVEGGGAEGGRSRYTSRIGPVKRDGRVVAAVIIATDVTERRRLEREVLEASDGERERIGLDLHDGLGQALTGVALLCKGLQSKLAARGAPEAADAERIVEHAEKAIGQTRDLAKGLVPISLGQGGLRGAIEDLAAGVERIAGVRCRFECGPLAQVDDHPKATHLFRIAQEAVNNALRHGHARQIVIRLARTESGSELIIRDDGIGLPNPPDEQKGLGLRSMRYRAGVLGGTFEVGNHPDGGTVLTCRVP